MSLDFHSLYRFPVQSWLRLPAAVWCAVTAAGSRSHGRLKPVHQLLLNLCVNSWFNVVAWTVVGN